MVYHLNAQSPWSILDDMERIFEGLDRSSYAREFPAMNVAQTDEAVTITCELPGMEQKDLELSLEHDTLTIKGRRELAVPEGVRVLRQERREFDFTRSLRLPFAVDAAKAEARLRDGVLYVVLPRSEQDKVRRIAISKA